MDIQRYPLMLYKSADDYRIVSAGDAESAARMDGYTEFAAIAATSVAATEAPAEAAPVAETLAIDEAPIPLTEAEEKAAIRARLAELGAEMPHHFAGLGKLQAALAEAEAAVVDTDQVAVEAEGSPKPQAPAPDASADQAA